jgi:histone H4
MSFDAEEFFAVAEIPTDAADESVPSYGESAVQSPRESAVQSPRESAELDDKPGAIDVPPTITAVRHKLKVQKGNVTNNDMRRLARRGGVRRISTNVMAPMRATFEAYLKEIVRRSIEITKCDGRKTIQGMDVVFAAKSQHAEHAAFYPGFMVASG